MDINLNPQWLAAAGLCWDLSAAIALSRGFFGLSNQQLKRLSRSYWGANPSAVRSFCEQRRDTRFGLIHLAVGSAIQILAALGLTISANQAWLCIGALAPVWVWFLSTYTTRTTTEAIQLSLTPDAQEQTWRKHFSDVSDLDWARIVVNNDIQFAAPPKP